MRSDQSTHTSSMLIRAGHAVRASVVFALVLLYTCQPGCWDCRRSCVRDWSSPVCRSEVDTNFPTAGSPAFLFHLRQYRTSRASLTDNVANEPLLSGVVSESCFVICDNRECCASRIKIKRSKCRCTYYSNSTTTFQCLLQGDLVFKLNPGSHGRSINHSRSLFRYTSSRPIVHQNKEPLES